MDVRDRRERLPRTAPLGLAAQPDRGRLGRRARGRAAPRRSTRTTSSTGFADALAELTPNQRRAILMREWQGLSYREIAEELSLSEGAVETLIFRARRSLARKLDRSRGASGAVSTSARRSPGARRRSAAARLRSRRRRSSSPPASTADRPVVLLHGSQRPRPCRFARSAALPVQSSSAPRRLHAPPRTRPRGGASTGAAQASPVSGPPLRLRRRPRRRPRLRPSRARSPLPVTQPTAPPAPPVAVPPPPPAAPPVRPSAAEDRGSASGQCRRCHPLPALPASPAAAAGQLPACRFRLCRSCSVAGFELRTAPGPAEEVALAAVLDARAPCRGRPSSRRPGRARRAAASARTAPTATSVKRMFSDGRVVPRRPRARRSSRSRAASRARARAR